MSWSDIAKFAASLALDLAREALTKRRTCEQCGWTFRDAKRANDAAHKAGHERA
jgi:hypothetical protein